ncbi:DUF6908 domain-containing protein [Leptospira santarosai]|uniref:DUF6908 domain-containing protein n=1 Tax=Leptospira santarosai TaxID=28183 RepID=UPI0002973441|nr:hypothetical protein [Leptospira santarosai]EKR91068.1 hypothetical protein LEP1GSC163_3186 [Leptospira santarosai str. CBC379]EMJ45860.1 hypothetical protein LEP1GSC169_0053 [Leptospira santarosai str. HAI1349]
MKMIHEIIRRHGGKRGVEASPIRIEKEQGSVLEIESIGKGPRGYDAIRVTQLVSKNGEWIVNPEICFEILLFGTWKMDGEDLKYEKEILYFPYTYIQEHMLNKDEVFEMNEEGQIKNTNQSKLDSLKVLSYLWDGIFEEQGYVDLYSEKNQSGENKV